MPAAFLFERGPAHPIKISATGDRRCYGDRIAYLHGFWFRIHRHREIADRSREIRRRVRQRLHIQFDWLTGEGHVDLLGFKKLFERIVHVEDVVRNSPARVRLRNKHDC